MSNRPPVRIDVVSDVVCPWCFIGKRRLEKAIAMVPDIAVEVHWRPYFLNDWMPREGISREEYLITKFGSVERYAGNIAARHRGSGRRRPRLAGSTRSAASRTRIDSHRLIRWAAGIGKAAEMKQRLMDLYFTEGGDLTNTAGAGAGGGRCRPRSGRTSARRSRATRTSKRSRRKCSRPRKPASRACPASSCRQIRRLRRASAGTSRPGDRARRAGASGAA